MRVALLGFGLLVSGLIARADQATRSPSGPTAGTAIITGRVIEAEGGQPVAAAVVSLSGATLSTSEGFSVRHGLVTSRAVTQQVSLSLLADGPPPGISAWM